VNTALLVIRARRQGVVAGLTITWTVPSAFFLLSVMHFLFVRLQLIVVST
jgi:hypothetical protein